MVGANSLHGKLQLHTVNRQLTDKTRKVYDTCFVSIPQTTKVYDTCFVSIPQTTKVYDTCCVSIPETTKTVRFFFFFFFFFVPGSDNLGTIPFFIFFFFFFSFFFFSLETIKVMLPKCFHPTTKIVLFRAHVISSHRQQR